MVDPKDYITQVYGKRHSQCTQVDLSRRDECPRCEAWKIYDLTVSDSLKVIEEPLSGMQAKAEKIDQAGGDSGLVRDTIWWLKDCAARIRKSRES